MDKSIVAVEEIHGRSNSLASASNSLGTIVQINSIAIDLTCAMEEIDAPAHEHFSIRGFVSRMRKKDQKMCWPFDSEVDGNNLVDILPPLPVPKFRWWQCSNCIPDNTAERTALEMLLADRNHDAGTSICQHAGGEKDYLSSCSILDIGGEHCRRDSVDGEENCPSNEIIKFTPECNGGQKATTRNIEKTEVTNNEGAIREKHNNNNNNNDDADATEIVCIAGNPSTRFDERENASSGSDGPYSALPRRRKPKLRTLADIMEDEDNSTSEHTKTRSALPSMQVISTEAKVDLDDPSVDFTAAKSLQRKRKMVVEEDRGTTGTPYPIGTTKRFKGPTTVEASDSESNGDLSARLDFAKSQHIKPKRNRTLDISRRMKRTDIDNRTVMTRDMPKINSVNLQKNAFPSKTSGGDAEHVHSTLRGELTPYFSSFLPGIQVDRISDPSKSKRPEAEADRSPLTPPRKSFTGDFYIQGKVALDLSLDGCMGAETSSNNQTSCRQHRAIPDLNESFNEKPSLTQGMHLPTLSDNRSLDPHRILDSSTFCNKQIVKEGKQQFGVSEPQDIRNLHNNVEHGGNSDDIPMEIVELLAKNQHERALGNSRNHLVPGSINSSIRRSPPVYVDKRPGTINFPFTNANCGTSVASAKMGVGQGILNFPQVNNCQLDENQVRLFSSLKPSQQKKIQYSVMTVPRGSEEADLLWPPRRKNAPFHVDIRQNGSIQPDGLGMPSFSDQRHKGKAISVMKGKEKKGVRDVKEGRIGSSSKTGGSLDAYSNDTIPAMQLLSLMDRGIAPSSSYRVGPNSFLDKSFSPCNHHPRLNGNEKQNDPFLNSSLFSQSTHTKDFSTVLNGVHFSSESLKKSYAQGQTRNTIFEGSSNLVIQPSRSNVALETCTLNRNPADFSIPGAKNEFTISAKDLKRRKRRSLKERSHDVSVDGLKRRKARKDTSGKELWRK